MATRFTAETRGYVVEMQNFTPPYMKGWTYVRTYSVWTIFSEPKFFGCIDLPNFLTHGAPLRALRVRELRYEKAAPSLVYDISPLFETGMKGDVEI